MKTSYRRIQFEEREEISRGLAEGLSLHEIGRRLGRDASTILREITAGSGNRYAYRACRAERRARRNAQKRRMGHRRIGRRRRLKRYVHAKLRLRWSPEQIAETLKRDYPEDMAMRISHEAIYTYLYVLARGTLKKELLSYLRQRHKRRRKKGETAGKAKKIPDMISIEERPAEVMERTIPGHWEGDLLIGKQRKSALGTLVERTTRALLLVPLPSKHAPVVRRAFARKAKRIPRELRLTLTYDQGTEMAEHRLFTQATQMRVYFAHPASPWERGTNENTNGLIRQFFPKGTDFRKVSRKEINHVQRLLNGRPRKVLGWRTPQEVFNELLR